MDLPTKTHYDPPPPRVSFADLLTVLKHVKPLPFLGFTMTPDFHHKIVTHPDYPIEQPNGMAKPVGHAPVVVLPTQLEPCLQWNDKLEMDLWIAAARQREKDGPRERKLK